MVLTDANGLATFTALTIQGYNNPNVVLAFWCEGVISLLAPAKPQTDASTDVRCQAVIALLRLLLL